VRCTPALNASSSWDKLLASRSSRTLCPNCLCIVLTLPND
jgi:hypothetical protein